MRPIKFRAWNDEIKTLIELIPTEWPLQVLQNDEKWKVMQFTGLVDKNGKEIYEGDVVTQFWNPFKNPELEKGERGEVKISPSQGVTVGGKPYWPHDGPEVIGNIYENPEFINEK